MKPQAHTSALKNGGLPELFTPYLSELIAQTGGPLGPIGRQFIAQPSLESYDPAAENSDPFDENANEAAPGLVYKYRGQIASVRPVFHGRGLWTISRFCASYCRFCFRGRVVGLPAHKKTNDGSTLGAKGFLTPEDIEKVFAFIKAHPELNEIILSGGDPFVTPQPYLTEIIDGLAQLQKQKHLDIVRISTRLPIHNPGALQDWHFALTAKIKNPYIMLHVNHPAELTPQTLQTLERFRRESLATIMSQTVLLKGVNDSVEILQQLFETLAREGIRPYYLFQNDPIPWARHHTVPFNEAQKIWSQLRPRLSGLAATAKFTIETEGSFGKIPVPDGDFWPVDYSEYKDFRGKKINPQQNV